MKKILITIVLVVLAGAALVYLYNTRQNASQPPQTDNYAGWGTYTDSAQGYTFRYPASFTREQDPDTNIVTFVNKNVAQETQPAFIYVKVEDNSGGLSLTSWWETQLRQGNRTVSPYQRVENQIVGGKPAIVIVPLDNGSTNYLFALNDKIMSVNAFLVEPYIDQIIASFQLATPSNPPSGHITVQGIMVCLPHKNPGEFQTLECAFGLKDAAGRYFALRDSDPTYSNVSGAPMNVQVEVEGTFTPQEDSKYNSIGVIEVSKITKL